MSRTILPRWLVFILLLRSVLSTPADWCEKNEATDIIDSVCYPNMLPPGHITMDAFSIDSQGRWYIAGSSDVDNVPFLWRVSSALDSYEVLAEGDKFIDIQVSLDGSAVFAVTAKSAIRSYDTALKNEYDLIEAEDTSFSWSGVAYDDSTGILFAAASKKNAVYQYTQGDGQWSTRVLAAGNPSGEALDTADGLNNPTVVRWYDGYLFIRVFDGVWQWKPFDSAATQTFGGIYVYGQRGLTVSPDNFVYYSKTNNKVYRKPISNPPDGPGDIFAGACGCGPESNQLCNSLESNLVTFTPSGQVIIQDYPELYGNPEDLSFRLLYNKWSCD
ncbi:hypothetical protein FOZ60_011350 [Perkinsus olseni]|uniref:Uncharacterized protein n=1 Tax=Perkinsus olseni TaxID=32597 RepID=A0A7J6NDL2_PEROL|nr:hypothetical protein FOZ60_011350 [Perkinsus olseni]